MSLGVNHLRVLMSQPTDRHDGCPVRQCLAALLPSRRFGHCWPASMLLQPEEVTQGVFCFCFYIF